MATVAVSDSVLDRLVEICGEEHVFAGKSARFNRARVPSPFPVHRWEEYVPDAVVLPTSAEQISEVVKLANRERIPVVPRAGGTGLTDGAVPLRHGIMVDVKLMNRILELDLEDRTVTVQPGINMLKLSEELRPHGFIYPDDPASYPCSLVGGRIGTSGWSLIGGRYGHTRDLVISFEIVLPTGEIIRVGDGGGKKMRKSSSGYQLKHLFMGHQGTLGIVTEATLELVKRPEAEFSAFYAYPSYLDAWRATGDFARSGAATLAGVVLFDEWKIDYLRRDDEAYIPQPEWVKARRGARHVRQRRTRCGPRPSACSGSARRPAASTWATRSPRATGPRATTATRRRCTAALADGQVVPMSWHCEDASIHYSQLAGRPREVARDRRRPARAVRHVRRLGHVRLHERRLQALGRLPHRDRHRHLGDALGRGELGRVGRREARDRAGRDRARRLDPRLPRLVPRGGGRPRAASSWAAASR